MNGSNGGVSSSTDPDDWGFDGSPLSCSGVEKRM